MIESTTPIRPFVFPGAALWDAVRKRWLLIAGIIAVIAIAVIVIQSVRGASSGPRYVTAPVQYGTIHATVAETGTVNPVNQVNVGTQVSGTITKIAVDFNSVVRKNQILAVIDQTSFQASDAQAQAALAQAQAAASAQSSGVTQAQANFQAAVASSHQVAAGVASAQAEVAKAQSQATLAELTVSRDRALLAQGYIAQNQVDLDTTNAAVAQKSLAAAMAVEKAAEAQATASAAQARAAAAQTTTAGFQAQAGQAQVASAAGQVAQSAYNLERTTIRSPIDGVVVSRNVSVGQTVAASLQTPTLFVVASNLKDMQVDVSVAEADVGNVRAGAAALIQVPAFPNVSFKGTVAQVRVNPTVTQNVVTYDAIVTVHDETARLMPGMTANVSIDIGQHNRTLLVPTAALLYQSRGGAGSTSSVSSAPGSRVQLTVLRGKKPVLVSATIGLSDANNVEVTSGDLKAGDRVVTGALQSSQVKTGSPFGASVRRGGGG
jgi:HlyD family secretion protein